MDVRYIAHDDGSGEVLPAAPQIDLNFVHHKMIEILQNYIPERSGIPIDKIVAEIELCLWDDDRMVEDMQKELDKQFPTLYQEPPPPPNLDDYMGE